MILDHEHKSGDKIHNQDLEKKTRKEEKNSQISTQREQTLVSWIVYVII